MSWSQFKDEVGSRMKEANWKTSDEWAKFFTKKYDECIKRGTDLSGKNPVLKGNTELMEQTLINAGNIALAAKLPIFYSSYMNLLGQGVIGYWSTATLQKMSTPIVPAPGTILNLQVTNNYCTNPGKFIGTPTPPTKEVDSFLNSFISAATIHLTTISGTTELISQYIPPLPIGPAIATWTGYKIEGVVNRRQSTAVVEKLEIPELEDDTPIVEGKAFMDHQKNNGRVKFDRVSDAINPELLEKPKRVIYKAPEPIRATSTTPETIQEPVRIPERSQQTTTPFTTDVLAPLKNLGKLSGTPPSAPGFSIYNNGFYPKEKLVPIQKAEGGSGYKGYYVLEPGAAAACSKWIAQAKSDGFGFTITSAYRDFEYQNKLVAGSADKKTKKKSAAVASAGNSVHGIALAIDIGELYRAAGGVGAADKNGIAINRRVRENSKLYQYLAKTGPSFGWYNPYRLADNAGTVDECWHFEYWGYYKK
jgi:LAS superfamily LD-carboxypeptidase LdcB